MRTNGQVHTSAGPEQFVGDLNSRRSSPDDEDCPVGELAGVAVAARMYLYKMALLGHDRRNRRRLKGSGRDNHIPCIDHPGRGLHEEPGSTTVGLRACYLHAAPNRRPDLLGVGSKVIGDLVFGRETVSTNIGKLEVRKSVVPRRAVRDQRIPTLRTPTLGDPAAFDDEVRQVASRQLPTHCQPGLPSADDQHFSRFTRFIHSSLSP